MSKMHPEIEAEYEKVLEIDRAFFDANPKSVSMFGLSLILRWMRR